MIVNPQVFNYRFTIGTLVVAIGILAAYSYTSYTSAESKEAFFKQEKKLLENQTSRIITSYDELNSINKELILDLDSTKNIIAQTQDSLEELQANMSLINKYKKELLELKKQHLSLSKKEDSFSLVTKELVKQNTSFSQLLNEQTGIISSLKEEKAKLGNDLKKAALVSANSFKAKAFTVKKSNIIETNIADKTNHFKITFSLAKNPLATTQEKEIYIQIIDPDNNIVADKGAIQFNESSLIYSYKTNIIYNKTTLDVLANVETNETLKPGRYFINIFDGDRLLGNTQIILQ